jgi:hypothetical protein
MAQQTTTIKRRIRPVTLTVQVKANKVNENGTFSGFEIISAKGPNKSFRVSAPFQGGGSLYLKVDSLEGLEMLSDDSTTASAAPKQKLF